MAPRRASAKVPSYGPSYFNEKSRRTRPEVIGVGTTGAPGAGAPLYFCWKVCITYLVL